MERFGTFKALVRKALSSPASLSPAPPPHHVGYDLLFAVTEGEGSREAEERPWPRDPLLQPHHPRLWRLDAGHSGALRPACLPSDTPVSLAERVARTLLLATPRHRRLLVVTDAFERCADGPEELVRAATAGLEGGTNRIVGLVLAVGCRELEAGTDARAFQARLDAFVCGFRVAAGRSVRVAVLGLPRSWAVSRGARGGEFDAVLECLPTRTADAEYAGRRPDVATGEAVQVQAARSAAAALLSRNHGCGPEGIAMSRPPKCVALGSEAVRVEWHPPLRGVAVHQAVKWRVVGGGGGAAFSSSREAAWWARLDVPDGAMEAVVHGLASSSLYDFCIEAQSASGALFASPCTRVLTGEGARSPPADQCVVVVPGPPMFPVCHAATTPKKSRCKSKGERKKESVCDEEAVDGGRESGACHHGGDTQAPPPDLVLAFDECEVAQHEVDEIPGGGWRTRFTSSPSPPSLEAQNDRGWPWALFTSATNGIASRTTDVCASPLGITIVVRLRLLDIVHGAADVDLVTILPPEDHGGEDERPKKSSKKSRRKKEAAASPEVVGRVGRGGKIDEIFGGSLMSLMGGSDSGILQVTGTDVRTPPVLMPHRDTLLGLTHDPVSQRTRLYVDGSLEAEGLAKPPALDAVALGAQARVCLSRSGCSEAHGARMGVAASWTDMRMWGRVLSRGQMEQEADASRRRTLMSHAA
jgi:hypothetical protein